MTPQHTMIFYVRDPLASAAFYSRMLETQPVDASPGFAAFKLNDYAMLGLWNSQGVAPTPTGAAGASELSFHAADSQAVDAWHKRWSEAGAEIAQAPTAMDFGYTFTALDPDGHRLRVFAER